MMTEFSVFFGNLILASTFSFYVFWELFLLCKTDAKCNFLLPSFLSVCPLERLLFGTSQGHTHKKQPASEGIHFEGLLGAEERPLIVCVCS